MPSFISPLDKNYISLKRAALLVAQDQAGIEPEAIMDLFKHALFTGEFEEARTSAWRVRQDSDWNLPLLRMEAPPNGRLCPPLAVDAQPQEYFAVKSATIADVLLERNALPGSPEDWAVFTGFPRNENAADDLRHMLARIPYETFPAKGQAILGDICLVKVTLCGWMTGKGYDLPPFLRDVRPAKRPSLRLVHSRHGETAAEVSRGRPPKAAWPRIEALIREMYASNPETPRSVLAFDAHKAAAAEFDEKDLPSLETVQRRMKSILDPDG